MRQETQERLQKLGRIIVIAENTERTGRPPYGADRTLMMSDAAYVQRTINTIQSLGLDTVLYDNPIKFNEAAPGHASDTILPMWAGTDGRNSLNYVAAVCEMHGLRYLGPDVHGRILERDKWLSKIVAERCGFSVPQGAAIIAAAGLTDLTRETINRPVVVKPRYDGSSIGISPDSLCQDCAAVEACVQRLASIGLRYLIIEEFAGGKEVHIPVMGDDSTIEVLGAFETFVPGRPDYFEGALFDAELKTTAPYAWDVRPIELPEELISPCKGLFAELGFPNLLRIDGKLIDGKFYFLEVNSLPDIGRKSVAGRSYEFRGSSYEDFISDLLLSALRDN